MEEIRIEKIKKIFVEYPPYRCKQIESAFFIFDLLGWNDLSVLPKSDREKIANEVPWLSYSDFFVSESKTEPTYKALLTLSDGRKIETVLIGNKDEDWTICVSTQVGCAMRCGFCATGKMGLFRNLTSDEIIDQYRFWRYFLKGQKSLESQKSLKGSGNPSSISLSGISSFSGFSSPYTSRISNIVYMGMGEPLNNYNNVRHSLNLLLKYTDLGETHITVSTVGIIPQMEKILTDEKWPKVRLAVSLHCADEERRRKIMPSTMKDFMPKLADWSKRYLEKFGNRRHHLTYEYVMLSGVNDSDEDARLLAKLVNSVGHVKVNLISYNFTDGAFAASSRESILDFQNKLKNCGVLATWRQSRGEDIAGACGQLIVGEKK